MDFLRSVLTVLVPLAIGVCLLTQARRFQSWAIKIREREGVKLFDGYVRSETYVVVIRITGAACIIVALLLLYVVVKN